nr:MAG TPA: hypothetical protein [Caudoviricetes sp.]
MVVVRVRFPEHYNFSCSLRVFIHICLMLAQLEPFIVLVAPFF